MLRTNPAPMLPGETLAAYRRTGAAELGRRQSRAWALDQVSGMPAAWGARLIDRWSTMYRVDPAAGNAAHRVECAAIEAAQRAGVPADAGDGELCDIADQSARDARRRVDEARAAVRPGARTQWGTVIPWRAIDGQAQAVVESSAALWALGEWFDALGLADVWQSTVERCSRVGSAIARACCARWWRRVLRRVHARAVEATARRIGLVHRRAGCYVSNESLHRRVAQNKRNQAALESVEAVNEKKQRYTLADLAARGTANKEIRRHELMTRIAGFELIAKDCGHAAYFVTLTCPSRMHAYRSAGAHGAEPNPRHDGTRPDEAQAHLVGQWRKFRAAADRRGLELYGFRIAEPNHDGTPHWHCLLFVPGIEGADAGGLLLGLLRRYFLDQCDPDEPGAARHRVTAEAIDWARGSAAGYVAKYVAKNIDGMHVGADLEGNPALESSARVEAWASTWRVRQFQQVGGAPVGVWRELRRMHPEQGQHSRPLADALAAVNGAAMLAERDHSETVQRYTAASGWRDYLRLQGGHRVKRSDQRMHVMREQSGELGRYGDVIAPAAVGIVLDEVITERRPALGIVPAMDVMRTITEQVESERCAWVIVPKGADPGVIPAGGAADRPWTRVNNCTLTDPGPMFLATVQRRAKVGRWVDWSKFRPGGRAQTDEAQRGRHEKQARRTEDTPSLGAASGR